MASDRKTLVGGLVMIAFAVAYGLAAADLRITSSLGIGPGAFPLTLAALLAFVGVLITVRGIRSTESTRIVIRSVRGLVLITAAPILFALTVRPLGVLPALAIAVLVGSMASRESSFLSAVVATLAIVLVSTFVFRWALGMPIALIGPWLQLP